MSGKTILEFGTITTVDAADKLVGVDVGDTTDSPGGTNKQFTKANLLKEYATLTGVETLTNKTLTSPVINTPTGDVATLTGTQTLTNKTLTTPVVDSFYQDAEKTKLMTTPDTDSDTLVGLAATQTLTNKTLTSPVINTPIGDVATLTGEQTLTNKTLTGPIINLWDGINSTPIYLAIGNNNAQSFTPSAPSGLFIIYQTGASATRFAFCSFRASGAAMSILWQNGSSFASSTSALTGTTGASGKITISSNGGKLYVENRLGTEVYHGYIFIGSN